MQLVAERKWGGYEKGKNQRGKELDEKVWQRKKAEMDFQGGHSRTAAVTGNRAEKHSEALLCLVSGSYLHHLFLILVSWF